MCCRISSTRCSSALPSSGGPSAPSFPRRAPGTGRGAPRSFHAGGGGVKARLGDAPAPVKTTPAPGRAGTGSDPRLPAPPLPHLPTSSLQLVHLPGWGHGEHRPRYGGAQPVPRPTVKRAGPQREEPTATPRRQARQGATSGRAGRGGGPRAGRAAPLHWPSAAGAIGKEAVAAARRVEALPGAGGSGGSGGAGRWAPGLARHEGDVRVRRLLRFLSPPSGALPAAAP